MSDNQQEQKQLECACVAIYECFQELLQQQKISAMEFLSIVGQLPIKPVDFAKYNTSGDLIR